MPTGCFGAGATEKRRYSALGSISAGLRGITVLDHCRLLRRGCGRAWNVQIRGVIIFDNV